MAAPTPPVEALEPAVAVATASSDAPARLRVDVRIGADEESLSTCLLDVRHAAATARTALQSSMDVLKRGSAGAFLGRTRDVLAELTTQIELSVNVLSHTCVL